MSAEIPWTVGPGETLPKAPPLARVEPEPESASAVEARYQAQYEAERVAFAEAYSRAMRVKLEAERDRALLDLQAARAAVAYWQARAEADEGK